MLDAAKAGLWKDAKDVRQTNLALLRANVPNDLGQSQTLRLVDGGSMGECERELLA